MQSTSDTSHQSSIVPSAAAAKNHAAKNGANPPVVQDELIANPRCLTTAAIKQLQENKDQKHISGQDYVVQITRIRDINEGKASAAKESGKPQEKKKANAIKYK